MPAYRNDILRKFIDLALHRTENMNELYSDDGRTFHVFKLCRTFFMESSKRKMFLIAK